MRVCHCRAVSDREITSLVREGVIDAARVGDYCGAGTACGGCLPEVERLVSETLCALPGRAASAPEPSLA
jgi:bacterioferritin-associated ferredoxin